MVIQDIRTSTREFIRCTQAQSDATPAVNDEIPLYYRVHGVFPYQNGWPRWASLAANPAEDIVPYHPAFASQDIDPICITRGCHIGTTCICRVLYERTCHQTIVGKFALCPISSAHFHKLLSSIYQMDIIDFDPLQAFFPTHLNSMKFRIAQCQVGHGDIIRVDRHIVIAPCNDHSIATTRSACESHSWSVDL